MNERMHGFEDEKSLSLEYGDNEITSHARSTMVSTDSILLLPSSHLHAQADRENEHFFPT